MARGKFEYWLTEDGLTLLEGWARDGLTDEQIAHNMGCAYSTFRVWKDKFPAFSAALKRSKEIVDYEVENALLKRAIGYKRTEQIATKDGDIVEIEKEVPPDVTAQIFWLKNRRPDKWRDKQEAMVSLNTGQLADLIDGLKEPVDDDLYSETAGVDGTLAQEQTEAD